ncbi:glycosyltransferase [Salinibacterium hongtaonis]|uniref:glycosyltransferase n=1 Tax=Homoserinimonas hongtaonis TaxID=2079791 RepID=UPI000D3A9CC9|nr:glycosyltransferase [Salinibacterium hongtaonis]AWB88799.1 hypothetical protein C2138_03880 [Salinibacterium hongtaonis]
MTSKITRVALVSMHTPPAQQPGTGDSGGLNVSLMGTAHELAARGIEVELLTRAEGPPSVTLIEPGVSMHAIPAGPPRTVAKGELRLLADEFGEAVARLAGRDSPRYDIIHSHYWLSGVATLPVALELRVPFVQSFHTLAALKNRHAGPGQALEPRARLGAEAYLAGQAGAVVAGSSAEVSSLIDDLRTPAERVWVIPPGVDTEHFSPTRAGAVDRARARHDLAEGRPVLAVVGRVQPLKDQELAIRALAAAGELRERVPLLVIAGDATPGEADYLASLRSLADELGVAEHIRFAGSLDRDAVADLLTTATATLIPSHSETFGIVALESAASGTPVIGYRSTGLTDSVAEGRSGILLDSRSPAVWAQAIVRLLENAELRATLSDGARDHALGHTWAATATALLGVYASLS